MSHFSILPKLPVPPLSSSLDRFLSSLRPLLSPDQYSRTLRLREDFERGQGVYLQERLVQLSQETQNWATHVWLQTRFLRNRDPLQLTNGSATIATRSKWSTEATKRETISKFIMYLAQLAHQIRTNTFNWDKIGTQHTEPYKRIFGAHRVPGLKIDTYQFSPHSNHIVVIKAGNVYKVPVQEAGILLAPEEMASLLRRVLEDREEGISLGLLTALDRDTCHTAREQLMTSEVNRHSLATIEECMFAVCIDDFEMSGLSGGDRIKTGIFGDFRNNFPTFDRWFGICHQIVVSRDGWLSATSEHSLFDGALNIDRISLFDTEYLQKTDLKVELLKWDISPPIVSLLKEARHFLSGICAQYDVHTLLYPSYGKEFIKKNNLYYQGYMQLAFQLAYYKMYHGLAPSYQPVSLRRYRGGRLEHPHIVTDESKVFIEAVNNNNFDFKEKYRLMQLALDKHKQIMIDVRNGNVYCKHILGLKMLAEQEDMKVELFQDETFHTFTQHNLTTSGIDGMSPSMSNHPMLSGVGHFVVFCPGEGQFQFCITTLLDSPLCTTSQQFGASICIAMDEMRLIVTQATNGMPSSKL